MLYNEKITIKINKKNIHYFIKDFENIKSGDIINIDIIDLIKYWEKSILKIKVQCDKCNKDFNIPIKLIDNVNNILCKACKTKQTNLKKYGVENVYQADEIKDKIKKITLEKYGVENVSQNQEIKKRKEETCLKNNNVKYPLQSDEIKEKIKQINLEKYGVENISQNEKIKKKKEETCLRNNGCKSGFLSPKIKQTNLEKYGNENPFGSSLIREKIKQTNLEKYGVENVFSSPEIIKKIRNTLYQNNSAPCSKIQRHLWELLGGELNYPLEKCSLDIAYPNENIYIEYNGGGHYAFNDLKIVNEKDKRRHYYIWRKYKMKLIKIVSFNDKLLNDEEIISLINECKNWLNNNNNTWIEINLNDMIIKSKKIIRNI